MKAVIQRVSKAAVTNVKEQKIVGEIGQGLFILIGIKKGDTEEAVKQLATKIKKLRIFEKVEGKMTDSVVDLKHSILLVSQFTLLANTKDGNRPSFLDAEEPTRARFLYELLRRELESEVTVQTGSFGNYMKIDVTLDGPVTIVLDL